MDGWNTSFLLGWPIFRGYVSFREGNEFGNAGQVHEMNQHDGAELKGSIELAPLAGVAWPSDQVDVKLFQLFEQLKFQLKIWRINFGMRF